MGFIYLVTSPIGKQYVGQTTETVDKRWDRHAATALRNGRKIKENKNINLQECRALNNAIRKYGKNSFKIEVIFECEEDWLDCMEIVFIAVYETLAPNGYNLTEGGGFRLKEHSEKSKDKLSKSRRIHTEYNLPRGICEIKDNKKKSYGFLVNINKKKYYYLNSSQTMDEKYELAMKCYEEINKGNIPEIKNKYKRNKSDELNIPKYIVRRGDKGFAFNRKNYKRKTFYKVNNTREQNLQNAINYLNSLDL